MSFEYKGYSHERALELDRRESELLSLELQLKYQETRLENTQRVLGIKEDLLDHEREMYDQHFNQLGVKVDSYIKHFSDSQNHTLNKTVQHQSSDMVRTTELSSQVSK